MRGAIALTGFGVSGCALRAPNTAATQLPQQPLPAPPVMSRPPEEVVAMYRAMPNEQFPLPAVPIGDIPPRFWRQRVSYKSPHRPGTLIVDTDQFFLHLVEKNGTAMRYGVALGRAGFGWSGRGVIAWKTKWPKWTPPASMIEREPHLEKYSYANGGMPPGLKNPLGARALYIYQNGRDTLYRVHGAPDHLGVGRAVSSGCVRLINQDAIDLYNRVPARGARIIVA